MQESGMDEQLPPPITSVSYNYRPGEPLREWGPGRAVTASLTLTIKEADAGEALIRFLDGETPSKDDLIAFGRLNSACVMSWYLPLILLHGPKAPLMAPEYAELIRNHTKLFRGR